MAWTGKVFNVGDILTAAQMNNLQADITAQANGDAGAPLQHWETMASSIFSVNSASITGGSDLFLADGMWVVSALPGADVGGGTGVKVSQNINGTYRVIAESLLETQHTGGLFFCPNSGDVKITAVTVGAVAYYQKLA